MTRQRASALLIGLGLVVALTGYGALVVRATALDGAAVAASARGALDEPAVRALLVERTVDAAASQLLGDAAVQSLRDEGVDVRADLEPIVTRVVASPEFAGAYERAAAQVHAHMLLDASVQPSIDLGPLVAQVSDELRATRPATAEHLRATDALVVEVPVDGLPDLGGIDAALTRTRSLAAVGVGIALVLASIATARRGSRYRPLRAVGRTVGTAGVVQLAGAFVAHLLLDGLPGDAAPIVAAVVDPILGQVALHGIAPFAVGVLAGVAAHHLRRRPVTRHADHGRAAFLTDDQGRPAEWRFDREYEPETLRTAPSTTAYGR
jgi:hypothetical protein